jgi:hypothetical protein
MTADEQDKFVEWMMANCDVSTTVSRKASQVSERTVMEHEVSEEDFVRSSGLIVCPCC